MFKDSPFHFVQLPKGFKSSKGRNMSELVLHYLIKGSTLPRSLQVNKQRVNRSLVIKRGSQERESKKDHGNYPTVTLLAPHGELKHHGRSLRSHSSIPTTCKPHNKSLHLDPNCCCQCSAHSSYFLHTRTAKTGPNNKCFALCQSLLFSRGSTCTSSVLPSPTLPSVSFSRSAPFEE